MGIKTDRLTANGQKEKYLFVFVASFVTFAAVLLPLIIYNKGYFLYYGDFNSQQLMFYQHCHDFIRENGFGWDWGTDLGSDIIGAYSFYLTGSPFFWFTTLFPSKAVLYIFPWLLCLKTAIAALTSYAYIRRFVKTPNAAAIGAMLYAFSGAQIFNVFFNHFHDVTAFFPLLLLAFEMRVQDNRRGVFALAVALCAFINYYFFASEVVFVILYFFIRCTAKSFKMDLKKFGLLAFESVLGVMIAALMFMPAALAVLGNPRLTESLYGIDMVVYGDPKRLYRIIQSLFMLPDMPARSNIFSSDTARWASIAAYLPMFSMAGVIAFLKKKKGHWAGKLAVASLICACVPFFNCAFQLFNGTYYARWFFMPVLIIAMMTAMAVDDTEIDIKSGVKGVTIVLAAISVIFVLPTYDKKTETVSYGKVAQYPDFGVIQLVGTIVPFIALIFVLYFLPNRKKMLKTMRTMTVVFCFVCSASMIWYGVAQGPENDYFIEHAIEGKIDLEAPEGDNSFFRIDTSDDVDNWPMFWGYPSMRCFQSTVSPSIMTFYQDTMGQTRNVATRIEPQYWGIRNVMSVKYYLYEIHNGKDLESAPVTGFDEYLGQQNWFYIYENKNYIPMGFVYDTYISLDYAKTLTAAQKSNLIMEAVFLTDEQIEKYSDIMQAYEGNDGKYDGKSREQLEEICRQKAESACYYFKERDDGFDAKIDLDKESMVFFSVPYDDGFTAFVNGKEVQIDNVFDGLMAIRVPQGDNEIRFEYETKGLKEGTILTIAGIIIFAAYMLIGRARDKKKQIVYQRYNEYDYTSLSDITDEQAAEMYDFKEDTEGTESIENTENTKDTENTEGSESTENTESTENNENGGE